MKKVFSIILVLTLVFGLATTTFAAGSTTAKKVHNIDSYVNVTADAVEVDEGGIVNLKAITLKYGSDLCNDLTGWNGEGVAAAKTVLNADGNYESNTVFTAPYVTEDMDITITYTIATTAGKSGVIFAGQDSTIITVKDVPVALTVAKVKIRVIAKSTTGNISDSDSSKNTQLTFEGTYQLSNGKTNTIDNFNVVIPAKDADGIKTAEVVIEDAENGINEVATFEVSKTLETGDELDWSAE